jgi:hypothetical protein
MPASALIAPLEQDLRAALPALVTRRALEPDEPTLLDRLVDLNDRNFDICLAYCTESFVLSPTAARVQAISDRIAAFPPRASAYNLVTGLILDSNAASTFTRETLLGPFLALQTRRLQKEYSDGQTDLDAASKAVGLVSGATTRPFLAC